MANVDFERIGNYLNENMSGEERLRFESDLVQNKDLAEAFALYSSIENTMRSTHGKLSGEDALRQTLKDLGAMYFTSPVSAMRPDEINETQPSSLKNMKTFSQEEDDVKSRSRVWQFWQRVAVAVGIIGIVTVSIVWFSRQQKNSDLNTVENKTNNPAIASPEKQKTDSDGTRPDTAASHPNASTMAQENNTAQRDSGMLSKRKSDALFAGFFKPDIAPEQHDEFLNDAFNAYEKNNYTKAIAEFEDVASTPLTRGETPDETLTIFQAQYYQALSYLALGNAKKAIAELKRTNSGDRFLQAKVQWYLALAYLKNSQVKEAYQLFSSLVQNKDAKQYQQKAANVLKDFDQ